MPGRSAEPSPTPGATHSPSSHPQVIHLRNLPFEVTDEELTELCSEYGTVVAIKGRVGEKKNQAFVEFLELKSAQAIVNRYQGPVDPARVRHWGSGDEDGECPNAWLQHAGNCPTPLHAEDCRMPWPAGEHVPAARLRAVPDSYRLAPGGAGQALLPSGDVEMAPPTPAACS